MNEKPHIDFHNSKSTWSMRSIDQKRNREDFTIN